MGFEKESEESRVENFTLEKQINVIEKTYFGRLLFSHQLLVFIYGIFLLMYEIKFLQEYVPIFHPLLIAWSGLIFLYNVFRKKVWKNIIYWKVLLIFMISAGITAITTAETGLTSNLKAWILTSLPLCIFYPLCFVDEDKRNYLKTFLITLSGAAIISALASLIAIGMYLIRLSGTITFGGITNGIGIQNYIPNDPTSAIILYGIYVDTNHAAIYALCFIIYGIILFLFVEKNKLKIRWKNWIVKSFAVVNILIQMCYFPLANSRGGWLSFGVSLFIVSFLFILSRITQIKKLYFKVFISLLGSASLVIALCMGFWIIRTGMSEVSLKIETYIMKKNEMNNVQENINTEHNKAEEEVASEKETKDNVGNVVNIKELQESSKINDTNTPMMDEDNINENSNINNLKIVDSQENSFDKKNESFGAGRLEIWKDTFKLYIHKPIMGEGPGNTWYYAPMYSPNGVISEKGADVHNSYLDLLLDYGVVGAVLLMSFWILCAKKILQYLFERKKQVDILIYLCILIVLITASGAFLISSAFINVTALYFLMLVTVGTIMKSTQKKVDEKDEGTK